MKTINDVINKLHRLIKQEENRTDHCDENGYGDGEACYEDGRSQGRFEAFQEILRFIIN